MGIASGEIVAAPRRFEHGNLDPRIRLDCAQFTNPVGVRNHGRWARRSPRRLVDETSAPSMRPATHPPRPETGA